MEEEHLIDADCGCKMFWKDMGPDYEQRFQFCEYHEKMAAPLRKLLADFELVFSDITKETT
jgi:hypothetical protein